MRATSTLIGPDSGLKQFKFMSTPKLSRYLLTLTLLVVTTAAPFPAVALALAELTYQLSKDGVPVGEIRETYTRTGNKYRIESETKGLGVYALVARGGIKMSSAGAVIKNGLQPQHFEHRKGKNENKTVLADFDWTTKKATFQHDGKTEVESLPPGTQDRLSLMYQFMFFQPRDKGFQFYMSNGKKIDQYRYVLIGKETLSTPMGAFKTTHYRKQKQSADDDGADLWLADSSPFLPVRLTIVESDGQKLQQDLQRWVVR